VLAEMKAETHPIDPDHISIGALMKACCNAGQVCGFFFPVTSSVFCSFHLIENKFLAGRTSKRSLPDDP